MGSEMCIRDRGKISHPAAGVQKKMLEEEGVFFTKEKINLSEFQWRSSGQSDHRNDIGSDIPRQGRLF